MKDGSIDVTIVGLGYVGLPLLKRCLEKKLKVGGIDKDVAKITCLTKRQSVLRHVSIGECVKALEKGT
jgi:UDP-N-acetyl-D-mannosaminuronate dehydrogenase